MADPANTPEASKPHEEVRTQPPAGVSWAGFGPIRHLGAVPTPEQQQEAEAKFLAGADLDD